ncbi:dienelactone hydrolase [Novosphingobium sp. PC22D]|uniref:dienelactone hydrolase family protein n=1 Tax=Novosphingobium sp. PC22D TaxID=1962403 RepID=UPI000BEFB4FF|nr:dienelactone hydrolase family protein [Novosphingobium sp. PC22D]PEQ10391.1 dienelactone hydrolase [Novosphingobium sp. PC22D]
MTDFAPVRCTHDGVALEGRIYSPGGAGPAPAVMLFPGGAGPGKTFYEYAKALTDLGYLAITVDMYGAEADLSTPENAGAHFIALLEAPERLRARCLVWLDAVRALPAVDPARIAALGYCFGGKCVLELARSGADLAFVTSFHGLLDTHAPAQAGAVKAEIAVWAAGRDPFVPRAQLDDLRGELDAAGAKYQLTVFSDAQHSFTDPDHEGIMEGIAFDPMASAVAWAGTLALLDGKIGRGAPGIVT